MSSFVSAPNCVVHSIDRNVTQRVRGLLHGHAQVHPSGDLETLCELAQRHGPMVIFLDALNRDLFKVAEELSRNFEECPIIVLGEDVSDPILALDQWVAFAVVSLQASNRALLRQFSVSQHHLEQLQRARDEAAEVQSRLQWQATSTPRPGQVIRGLLEAFARFRSPEELLERFTEWIVQHYDVSVAGIYWREPGSEHDYVATVSGRGGSSPGNLSDQNAFVHYLRKSHFIVHSSTLHRLRGPQRVICEEALECFGAQAVFPMIGGPGLTGWLFVGGSSLQELVLEDLKELKMISSCLTAFLERAEERQLLAGISESGSHDSEALLEKVHVSVMMLDAQMEVTWMNDSARTLLAERLLDSKALAVSVPCLNEVIVQTLADTGASTKVWSPIDHYGRYAVTAIEMKGSGDEHCLVVIQDVTPDLILEGGEFGEGLPTSAMRSNLCTKIRDPLVAIKTFIELLPERHLDPGFCDEFVPLITGSVARLENLTETLERQGGGPLAKTSVEYALRHLLEDVFSEIGESLSAHAVKNTRDVFLNWPVERRRVLTEHLAHLASVDAWAAPSTLIEWIDLAESGEVRLIVRRERDPVLCNVSKSSSAMEGLDQFLQRHQGSLDFQTQAHAYTLNITVPKVTI